MPPSSGLSLYRLLLPNSCASRSASPAVAAAAGGGGLSVKRTVLDVARVPLGRRFDIDEDGRALGDAPVGDVVACSKSVLRAGSFGCVRVDSVEGEEKPWNCAVKSLYCFWRPGRASSIVSAPLLIH